MDSLRALIGKERSLREVAQAIHFGARAFPTAVHGALHVTCADETEQECAETLRQGFAQYLLPPLKFARRAPFRIASLGGRYEWSAARLAEDHFATPASERSFKLLVVKINAHVAFQEQSGSGAGSSFRLGQFERYGRASTSCGALHALLEGGHGPAVDDLSEAFHSEGHDRLAALRDETRVESRYVPLYSAIVSARLQARKALLDIQDYTPVSPTYYVVLPCVTINRKERDTEVVVGMYTVDGRQGGREAVYYGLGDRPEAYATTIEHKRFSITDDQLGEERKGRDHRAMVRAALLEHAPTGKIKVHDERLNRVRADVERNRHRNHNHARSLLRIALPVLAEIAPIPVAMLAFADGAAGIHHAFKIHKLAERMKGTAEAREILEEIEGRIDQLDPQHAEALLELLVADYK